MSDRKFLLQKKVENRIENVLGHKFRSGYAMVCYGGAGNVTYRNAFILSRVQVCYRAVLPVVFLNATTMRTIIFSLFLTGTIVCWSPDN